MDLSSLSPAVRSHGDVEIHCNVPQLSYMTAEWRDMQFTSWTYRKRCEKKRRRRIKNENLLSVTLFRLNTNKQKYHVRMMYDPHWALFGLFRNLRVTLRWLDPLFYTIKAFSSKLEWKLVQPVSLLAQVRLCKTTEWILVFRWTEKHFQINSTPY